MVQFRYSDPYLNRFLQPDSITPNIYNPQNLNRYSFVGNNPINFSDPTGHWRTEDTGSRDGCYDTKYCNGGQPKSADELKKMRKSNVMADGNSDSFDRRDPTPSYFMGQNNHKQIVCESNPFCAHVEIPQLPSLSDVLFGTRNFLGNFDISPNGLVPVDGNILEAYSNSRAAWFASHPLDPDNNYITQAYDIGDIILAVGVPVGATIIDYGIDQITNTGP